MKHFKNELDKIKYYKLYLKNAHNDFWSEEDLKEMKIYLDQVQEKYGTTEVNIIKELIR